MREPRPETQLGPWESTLESIDTPALDPARPTLRVTQKILTALRIGAHRDTAARWAGVEPDTLRAWLTQAGEPYGAFRRAVEQAEAGFELRLLAIIVESGDPALALALLQQRFPERWGWVSTGPERDVTVTFDLAAMLERIHRAVKRDPA